VPAGRAVATCCAARASAGVATSPRATITPPPARSPPGASTPANGATRTVSPAGSPAAIGPRPRRGSQRSAVIAGVTTLANPSASRSPSAHDTRGRRPIRGATSNREPAALPWGPRLPDADHPGDVWYHDEYELEAPERLCPSDPATSHIEMSNSARVRGPLIGGNFMPRSTRARQLNSGPLVLPLIRTCETRPLLPSMLM
jgi:hypothetical protein